MSNIILIGMPGVGKSSTGVILAKEIGYNFVDSDLLIQESEKKLLKDIISEKGIDEFLRIENEVNASIQTDRSVIATGGSVVYGKEAMEHLQSIGTIVYMRCPYDRLIKRLGDVKGRGVVLREGQTLRMIYEERCLLYEKYADITVEEGRCGVEKTLSALIAKLREGKAI